MITLEYLRDFKVGPFTMFDTTLAFVGVLIVSPILTWLVAKLNYKVPLVSWLWFTVPVSIIFHAIFQQDTPLIKILTDPHTLAFYVAIIVLVFMTYMGTINVSKLPDSEIAK